MKVCLIACIVLAFACDSLVGKNVENVRFSQSNLFNTHEILEGLVDIVTEGVRASPHIVGGKSVMPHSHPHQVALKMTFPSGDYKWCGGSLISPQWVISAAHCTPHAKVIYAFLGVHDLAAREEMKQTLKVVEIVTRPDWDGHATNDLTLLKLERSAKLDKYVQTIRLPKLSEKNKTYWSYVGTITGWGKESDALPQSTVLLHADTLVVTNLYCKLKFGYNIIKDSNICTDGSTGKRICTGDSGGPLVVTDGGQRVLIGVSSFGSNKGCDADFPSAFVRVTYYLDWIAQVTQIKLEK